MKKDQQPYIFSKVDDNPDSAEEIVSLLIKLFQPSSVVDFGCGLGSFITAFKEKSVQKILGLDGWWAKKDPEFKIKDEKDFIEIDLTKSIQLAQKFDLVLCLEVAEHLQEQASDILIQNLVSAGNKIIFAAAVPGQGGINHVNEQWPEYWKEKFLQKDFIWHDLIRPVIWNNKSVNWWYRQNTYLVIHKDEVFDERIFHPFFIKEPVNYLHPGILETRNHELTKLLNGGEGVTTYLKLLYKSIRKKF